MYDGKASDKEENIHVEYGYFFVWNRPDSRFKKCGASGTSNE
jgi:hypothetical protein